MSLPLICLTSAVLIRQFENPVALLLLCPSAQSMPSFHRRSWLRLRLWLRLRGQGDLVALVFHFVFGVEVHKVDPLLSFGATVFGIVAWLPTAKTSKVSSRRAHCYRVGAVSPWLGSLVPIL